MNTYQSPFVGRYASKDMLYLFSPDKKFSTWRRLWLALARAEKTLGLDITEAQLDELAAHLDDIDYDVAASYEKRLRHDVMAHIHTYGELCPAAMPVIHLGATSCYVTDNTDIIILREALSLVASKLLRVMSNLAAFADKYKALPTLGFTHFQPAQPVTVGKRAALWLYDFVSDFEEVTHRISTLALLGSKGTTGTQASFLELFGGDHEKVKRLETLIAADMGFDAVAPVSGQTYSRKVDWNVLAVLSGVAQSASKFATDLRLLSHLKEVEEPYEASQIGSSAMPYKRNPMRSERVCALARYVINDAQNASMTAATQWFERTLDDSANRRIAVAEGFLATDAILELLINITENLAVHEKVIAKHLLEELPFMATENIMMDAVKAGGDRQELHEKIRQHSVAAGRTIKEKGLPNDLVSRLAADPAFGMTEQQIRDKLDPSLYIGRAPQQVEEFLRDVVQPLLQQHNDEIANGEGVRV